MGKAKPQKVIVWNDPNIGQVELKVLMMVMKASDEGDEGSPATNMNNLSIMESLTKLYVVWFHY